ncbi:MAG TPA: hypothetical protein VD767_09195 [Thermomicrobiales bacterium]|nr:hypothetical protein [Thermomicrobiales bacterium]
MPRSFHLHLIRITIFALIAVALGSLASSPALAGDEAPAGTPEIETEQIKVAAVLCNDWSCFDFGDRIDDFTITAIDMESDEVLDSCVTDTATETAGCLLEVPSGSMWTLTFDDAQTPDGYIYHGSVIAVSGGAHGEMSYIPFHPLEDPEPGHSVVQAALCTDASCTEYEEFLDDFWIQAVNPVTGQVYDECFTNNDEQGLDHQCILDVPAKGEVQYRWDEDEVPDGYVPFGKPIVAGDPVVSTIAFKPVADGAPTPTEAPVTRLPVTGTSQPADGNGSILALALGGGLLLAVLGIIQVRAAGKRHR